MSNRFLWCTTWCRVHYFAEITVNVLAIVLASLFLSMQMCIRLGWTNRCSCAVDHGMHNFSVWVFQICGKKRHHSCRFHWSFFHSEWRVMESYQTVFSGVLPGLSMQLNQKWTFMTFTVMQEQWQDVDILDIWIFVYK